MAANTTNSNGSSFLTSLLGVLAAIFVFIVVVVVTLWISYGEPAPTARYFPDAPTAADLRVQEAEVLGSYGWIDQEKGIVRIPVEEAKELVIQELNQ